MRETSCAFTGHRPVKIPWRFDESDLQCVELQMELTAQIVKLAKCGVTNFFSGMTEGTECDCAEIVLKLRKKNPALTLHCVLPCEGQADKWSHSAQKQYYKILMQADCIDYVSRKHYNGCMMERNRRLVEQAGILLAVYNGTRRDSTGGTINYARKMGREIIVIDPVTRHIFHEESANM